MESNTENQASPKNSDIYSQIEMPTPKYSGKYEILFFFYSILLFGFYRILSISDVYVETNGISIRDVPFVEGVGFLIFDVIFSTFAYLTAVLLATGWAQRLVKKSLKNNDGQMISVFLASLSLVYLFLGNLIGFPQMNEFTSVLNNYLGGPGFWYLKALLLAICFYLGVQTVFYLAKLRHIKKNLVKLLRHVLSGKQNSETSHKTKQDKVLMKRFSVHFIGLLLTSPLILLTLNLGNNAWLPFLAPVVVFFLFYLAKLPFFNQNKKGFTFGDLLTVGLGVGIVSLFQTTLPITWCYTLPVALILMINTTNLGREHFNYSYVPKSGHEIPELINMVLLAIITFIPLAALVNFIDLSAFWGNTGISGITLIKYIGNWIYLVGVAEEVIFRVGLLIFLRDVIVFRTKNKKLGGMLGKIQESPNLTAMILSAVLFGLAHAPKGWNYAFLAMVAGLLYGFPFCKNKNLFGAVVLHAVVDVIAVAYFSAVL